jgi:Tol biopolymer transport system component
MVAAGYLDIIDVVSGELERISLTDWSGPYTGIQWSPTGHSIVAGQATDVLAPVAQLPAQIMEYDLRSGRRRGLFWAQVQVPWGAPRFSVLVVLNPDQIIFDEHLVSAQLIEVPMEGALGTKPQRVLTRGQGRDRQPAYSPDGARVLFSSNRSGNVDLWTVDRSTGVLQQLTDDRANDWDPAFTPDGRHILWSSDRSGNMEIWMAAADGSRARQITHDGVDAENPTMTPDLQWIVYASANDRGLGVWKIRSDGSDATHLLETAGVVPEVSPDGRYALFVRNIGQLYLTRAVDIETGEIVDFGTQITAPARARNITFGRARWMPSGKAIIYVGQDEADRTGIYLQDFVPGTNTSASRRPVAGFTADFDVESLGLSPDGKNVVISAHYVRRSLKLAEHVGLSTWN